MGQLNLFKLRQAYLTTKVSNNVKGLLTELHVINLRIQEWYDDESKAITLMARAQDSTMNEKVRIYHNGLHDQFRKRSSITRLETETGIKEGHDECAKALEDNVAKHLLNPAPLDQFSQDLLLQEVEQTFTREDNDRLKTIPTKAEILTVLKSCRPHAAPGTDSLTAHFYQQLWHIMGDPLTEVLQSIFQGNKPTACQRTSLMVFGNKPGKKAKCYLCPVVSLMLKGVSEARPGGARTWWESVVYRSRGEWE